MPEEERAGLRSGLPAAALARRGFGVKMRETVVNMRQTVPNQAVLEPSPPGSLGARVAAGALRFGAAEAVDAGFEHRPDRVRIRGPSLSLSGVLPAEEACHIPVGAHALSALDHGRCSRLYVPGQGVIDHLLSLAAGAGGDLDIQRHPIREQLLILGRRGSRALDADCGNGAGRRAGCLLRCGSRWWSTDADALDRDRRQRCHLVEGIEPGIDILGPVPLFRREMGVEERGSPVEGGVAVGFSYSVVARFRARRTGLVSTRIVGSSSSRSVQVITPTDTRSDPANQRRLAEAHWIQKFSPHRRYRGVAGWTAPRSGLLQRCWCAVLG